MADPQYSEPPVEIPDPSRARTKPHVFDPDRAAAEWRTFNAALRDEVADDTERARIAELHRAMR